MLGFSLGLGNVGYCSFSDLNIYFLASGEPKNGEDLICRVFNVDENAAVIAGFTSEILASTTFYLVAEGDQVRFLWPSALITFCLSHRLQTP